MVTIGIIQIITGAAMIGVGLYTVAKIERVDFRIGGALMTGCGFGFIVLGILTLAGCCMR